MRRKTKKAAAKTGSKDTSRSYDEGVSATATMEMKKIGITNCRHCGGLLRFASDEVTCVMCGRSADHHCENCLYDEKRSVAA